MRCCFREIWPYSVQVSSWAQGTPLQLQYLHSSMTSCNVCKSFVLQPICAVLPMSIYHVHAVMILVYKQARQRTPKQALVLVLLIFVSYESLTCRHSAESCNSTLGEKFFSATGLTFRFSKHLFSKTPFMRDSNG